MTTPPASVDVAIAGGGIAGLTAALAFAAKGFGVLVLERAPAIEAVGAGLQLSPNATRILSRLGALDALEPVAVRPEAIVLRSAASLKALARVPLGETAQERWGAPYLVVHRADLQGALAGHVADHPNITLLNGARATGVEFDTDGATLSFERAGENGRVSCRFAIGADGVWSGLRGHVRADPASRFSGFVAWRAMLQVADTTDAYAIFDKASVNAFLSPRFHLVAYPVSGGSAVNLVAVTRGHALDRDWSVAAGSGALENAAFRAAPALKALIAKAGPWTTWPIHTVDAAPPWTYPGGLALIGDAAHAMTPFSAQGAAMAVEDAAVLAQCVSSAADMASALAAYEAARRPRVERVAARGAFNRFVWHAGGPIALGRDLVLMARPATHLLRDFDWLYGWDGAGGSAS